MGGLIGGTIIQEKCPITIQRNNFWELLAIAKSSEE
jgi:hypothetical protein